MKYILVLLLTVLPTIPVTYSVHHQKQHPKPMLSPACHKALLLSSFLLFSTDNVIRRSVFKAIDNIKQKSALVDEALCKLSSLEPGLKYWYQKAKQ